MRRAIGGGLSIEALARLHFLALDRAEQAQAIRRLAARGWSEPAIERITALPIDEIRRALRAPEVA